MKQQFSNRQITGLKNAYELSRVNGDTEAMQIIKEYKNTSEDETTVERTIWFDRAGAIKEAAKLILEGKDQVSAIHCVSGVPYGFSAYCINPKYMIMSDYIRFEIEVNQRVSESKQLH